MENENSIKEIINDLIICESCRNQFKEINSTYKLDIEWRVFYEYNEFLERLLFRYKEQRDVVLAPIFFEKYASKIKDLESKYTICVMCSSDESRMKRGFEPIIEMLEVHGIQVYSPLYKTKDVKQSSMSKKNREDIKNIIRRKEYYPLPNKPILLIDDVLTTGSTLQAGIALLKPKKVIVLCANPMWIHRMKVEKQNLF